MAKKKVELTKAARKTPSRKGSGGPRTAEGKKRAMANLKPWEKGKSGNTKGRPPGSSLSQIMKIMMESHPKHMPYVMRIAEDRGFEITKDTTVGDVMNAVIFQGAMLGSDRKLEMLLDRVEGKVVQKVEQKLDASIDGGSVSVDTLKLDLATRKKVLRAMQEAQSKGEADEE